MTHPGAGLMMTQQQGVAHAHSAKSTLNAVPGSSAGGATAAGAAQDGSRGGEEELEGLTEALAAAAVEHLGDGGGPMASQFVRK